MRTYLILKDKARQFREDAEIQALLSAIGGEAARIDPYSRQALARLRARTFDRAQLAARRLPYERLDQLVVELLMGIR